MSASQQSIARKIFDTHESGTNGADMLLFSRNSGLQAVSFNGTALMLKKLVNLGFPVIVLQDNNKTERAAHYRIVVGYNDTRKVFVVRDNTMEQYLNLPYSEFEDLWDIHGRWAMLIAPPNRTEYESAVDGGNAVCHMDLAIAYSKNRNKSGARNECLKALQLEPQNPFARKLLLQLK